MKPLFPNIKIERDSGDTVRPTTMGDVLLPDNVNMGQYLKRGSEQGLLDLSKQIKLPNWIKDPENLEKILSGQYRDIKPITAEFVPTLNCNYRCTQCAYSKAKKDSGLWATSQKKGLLPKYHMSEDVMMFSLDRLVEGGVKNILFTGGGEPLINKSTLKGMRHAKNNGNVVALYTNGVVLNSEKIDELIEIDPLFIRISVYGGNQETVANYTHTKDNKSFERVIRNITELIKQKKKAKSDVNIGLSYLVHPLTQDSITEFAQEIRKIDVINALDYIRFTPAVEYFDGPQHDQGMMEETFKGIEHNVSPMFTDTDVSIKLYYHRLNDLNSEKQYNTCLASGWFIEVGPSGEVFLCCEKHFLEDYKIGNLMTHTIDEIWKSDLRKNVIDNVNNHYCKSCPTLCKPHELNKVFNEIETYRQEGNINKIKKWSSDLLKYRAACDFCPGQMDDFQS